MKIDNKIRLVTVLSAVMLIQMLPGAIATPKHRTPSPIIFDIVHAIPAGFGADIVDVYANDKLIIDNATPGAVKAITGESGPVVVSIYANGVVPGPTTQPVLTTSPIYLSSNSKYSFVAHLTATGEPIIDIFKNMTVEPGSKRAWLTVRHAFGAAITEWVINAMNASMASLVAMFLCGALIALVSASVINPTSD